ncbi:MAG: hypothetical protein ACHREM_17395 [Polyangiales bacterium]
MIRHYVVQTLARLAVVGAAGACAAACAVAPQDGNVGSEPISNASNGTGAAEGSTAGAVTTEAAGAKTLLASIALSDTQVIRFWEHSHGVVQVEESGDIDRDLRDAAPGHTTLLRTNIDGMSLADAYRLLAGTTVDEVAIAKLAGADVRLGKLTPARPSNGTGNAETGAPVSSSATASSHHLTPMGLTQCQLTTNSWNWPNDIAWFKNTFCGNDSVSCFANANYWWVDSWASYSYENSWFHATGFEGSFCDSANFDFTLKVTGCDSTTLIFPDVFPLAPRHYNTQNWYTSGCTFSANWDARVNANWTGLDSQVRLGLAVHRQ